MIRFLLKSVFWLSLAFIAMPHFFPAREDNKAGQNPVVSGNDPQSVDQILAHGRTAVEIGKLCIDNPSFCEQGTSLAASAGSSVLKGSGQLLDFLSESFGNKTNTALPQQPTAAAPFSSAKGDIPVPTARAEALRTRSYVPGTQ